MGEETNKEEKEEDVSQEVVLKVDMHCEACAKKVAKSLRGFKGVEKVSVDCKASKVVVKATKEVDPVQLQDRLHKKTNRKVDVLSSLPLPKPEPEQSKPVASEDPPKKNEAAEPPPPAVTKTVVLQVGMHCDACAQDLRRHIRKIPGVESVETDMANDRVTVKGVIDDPEKLAQLVNKRTRKHASIVKEDEKAKPEDPKGEDQKDDTEKKKDDTEKKKDGESGEGEEDNKSESDLLDRFEHFPARASMEYYYSNAPELFSDENPNACSVM